MYPLLSKECAARQLTKIIRFVRHLKVSSDDVIFVDESRGSLTCNLFPDEIRAGNIGEGFMKSLLKGRGAKGDDATYMLAMKTFLPLVYGINQMKLKMKLNGNIMSRAVPVTVEATTILFVRNVWEQAKARAKVMPKPAQWNKAQDKERDL